MTLVLTEISRFGVVMVAEMARGQVPGLPSEGHPEPGGCDTPTVQIIPNLKAGISVWGRVRPGPEGHADVRGWLNAFIEQCGNGHDLEALAEELAGELQRLPRALEDPAGFHIAGYTDVDGEKTPVLFHVRNNESDAGGYYMHDFEAVREFLSEPPGERGRRMWSCDVGRFAELCGRVEAMLSAIDEPAELGLSLPHPSLEGRMAYLATCVQFVSGLYGSGLQTKATEPQMGHGGRRCFTVVGIPPTGFVRYRTTG